MTWDQGGLEMPIKKPDQLIQLEQMPLDVLQAMTQEEMLARVKHAADALAWHYMQERGKSCQECIEVISSMLESSGGPIGGQVGAALVARASLEATRACCECF